MTPSEITQQGKQCIGALECWSNERIRWTGTYVHVNLNHGKAQVRARD